MFRRALEALSHLETSKITVSGIENLNRLNELTGGRCIISPSHRRDSDITIAAATLMNHPEVQAVRNINPMIADVSPHHSFGTDPTSYGMLLAGMRSRFFPVDFKHEDNGYLALPFNPENFTPMIEALHSGKADIVIAAQNPVYEQAREKEEPLNSSLAGVSRDAGLRKRELGEDDPTGHLPQGWSSELPTPPEEKKRQNTSRPGNGAAYLAARTHVPILPIRITYTDVPGKKPEAHVTICEPIEPGEIDVEEIDRIRKKYLDYRQSPEWKKQQKFQENELQIKKMRESLEQERANSGRETRASRQILQQLFERRRKYFTPTQEQPEPPDGYSPLTQQEQQTVAQAKPTEEEISILRTLRKSLDEKAQEILAAVL